LGIEMSAVSLGLVLWKQQQENYQSTNKIYWKHSTPDGTKLALNHHTTFTTTLVFQKSKWQSSLKNKFFHSSFLRVSNQLFDCRAYYWWIVVPSTKRWFVWHFYSEFACHNWRPEWLH
jgi:hypothetical protein